MHIFHLLYFPVLDVIGTIVKLSLFIESCFVKTIAKNGKRVSFFLNQNLGETVYLYWIFLTCDSLVG